MSTTVTGFAWYYLFVTRPSCHSNSLLTPAIAANTRYFIGVITYPAFFIHHILQSHSLYAASDKTTEFAK